MWHRVFYIISVIICSSIIGLSLIWTDAYYLLILVVPIIILRIGGVAANPKPAFFILSKHCFRDS